MRQLVPAHSASQLHSPEEGRCEDDCDSHSEGTLRLEMPARLQILADFLQKVLGAEGLGYESIAAHLTGGLRQSVPDISGYRNDWNFGSGVVSPQNLYHLNPAHLRHGKIGKDQMRTELLRFFERVLPTISCKRYVARCAQSVQENPHDVWIVFNDQNSLGHGGSGYIMA